jgi:predicted RNA-binding Zn-ribbon protein involved in translation (DUF1610 family)
MARSWNSDTDICPVCQAGLGLTEEEVTFPVACPNCGTQLMVRPKYYRLYVVVSCALGFLVAYIQKLEGPLLFGASLLYTLAILLGLGYWVLPFLPQELKVVSTHVQGLGIKDDKQRRP